MDVLNVIGDFGMSGGSRLLVVDVDNPVTCGIKLGKNCYTLCPAHLTSGEGGPAPYPCSSRSPRLTIASVA